MLESSSVQFKIFPGCNSKEFYYYLDTTLENGNVGNVVIHMGNERYQ